MEGITDEELHNFLINTGDARHRRVSRMVEEVQRIMLELTTQISSWDSRFYSISNSGIHSDNLKDQPDLLAHWMVLLRGRRSLHPCIQSFGFDLIARTNYHWQLSFLRAERLLLEGMDDDGGCRMKCLRVVRQLKEDVWCPGSRPVITSQHLQMILLWECERNPSSKSWLDFGSSFLRLVRRLLKCSRQRFLRHYFVRRANLLKYADANQLDKLADKLNRFLKCPTLNLSSYYDQGSVC